MAERVTSATSAIRIRAGGGTVRGDLAELVAYRDLVLLLVRRDLLAKYQQTILGPTWMVFQPLVMTLVFVFVFHRVAGLGTAGATPALFYLAGLVTWNFAAAVFGATAGVFTGNQRVLQKVYLPRFVLPVAAVLQQLIPLGIQLATLVACSLALEPAPGATRGLSWGGLLVLPAILAATALASAGFGLLYACATAKYRDLQHALPFVVQVGLYLTPVAYAASQVPEGLRWLVALNPLAPLVEATRSLLLVGPPAPSAAALALAAAAALGLGAAGTALYRWTARTVTDYL